LRKLGQEKTLFPIWARAYRLQGCKVVIANAHSSNAWGYRSLFGLKVEFTQKVSGVEIAGRWLEECQTASHFNLRKCYELFCPSK